MMKKKRYNTLTASKCWITAVMGVQSFPFYPYSMAGMRFLLFFYPKIA
jgi:hypothetical protein